MDGDRDSGEERWLGRQRDTSVWQWVEQWRHGWFGGLNTSQGREPLRGSEISKVQQRPLQAWPRPSCHPTHGKEDSLSPDSA